MKSRLLSCLLLYLLGSGTMGMAQLPFGKKLPPPAVNSRDEYILNYLNPKEERLPSVSFDTITKQFVRHSPGQKTTSYTETNFSRFSQSNQAAKTPGSTTPAFRLTKDINTLAESFPENNPANALYSFAVLNNVSYFFSDDGIHGRELWRSDGTTAGTYLVKDINPGEASSGWSNIIAANGLLFFTAASDEYGQEPWVSDGTEAGTHLLKDIFPANGSSQPTQFVEVNGFVFFTVSFSGLSEQLWKTDGTEAGTTLVKDLMQSFTGYRIFELMEANNLAYFIAFTWNSGYQLFRSDGTDAGTYLVRDIGFNSDPDGLTAPTQLTEYDNKLFFSANDGSGRKLWVSDGTFDGTTPAPGNNDVFMQEEYNSIYKNYSFRILNNVLYIAGYTFTDGGGLYKYDASDANGVVLVKDLTDIPDFPYDDIVNFVVPVDFTVINDKLYFKVISNTDGIHDELWSTDGQADHTQLIKAFPAEQSVYPYNFMNGNGTLYFVVNNDATYGTELWSSDGTLAGTGIVKDINTGKGSSFPDDLTFCNGKLLFRATNPVSGSELWSTTGSEGSTLLVKDINTTTTNGSEAGFAFKGVGLTGKGIVFNAFTPSLGYELYQSDGTISGTTLLNDITAGEAGSYPNNYISKNNVTYFIGDNAIGTALYKTDGTPAGLQRITTYINRDQFFVLNYNVTDQGLAFYTLGNRFTGAYELWRSNGTDAGTYLLTSNLSYYSNNYIELIGNTAFFIAGDFNTGYELWKSDGSVAGTIMVKDINPGPSGSDPYSFYVYKNTLYFGALDGLGINSHRSLWKSDGTEKGTVKLKNVEPVFYRSYFNTESQHVFCESNGALYFAAMEFNTYGNELWKTNGTEAGTKLVKDINPYASSSPDHLTDVKGTLYFTADDGVHGRELWTTNGSEKGTTLVKDMTPGFESSYSSFCSAGGKLYFLNANTYPTKIWSSGGTANTTNEVVDDGLAGLFDISKLTASGNKLFFGAYTKNYGTEMYVGDATATTLNATMVRSANKPVENNSVFAAGLYPNPAKDKAVLHIESGIEKATVSIVDLNGKTIWQKVFSNETAIHLPMEKLIAGVYVVSVKTDNFNRTYRLIKE